jgi:hypothetical protein
MRHRELREWASQHLRANCGWTGEHISDLVGAPFVFRFVEPEDATKNPDALCEIYGRIGSFELNYEAPKFIGDSSCMNLAITPMSIHRTGIEHPEQPDSEFPGKVSVIAVYAQAPNESAPPYNSYLFVEYRDKQAAFTGTLDLHSTSGRT